MRRRFLRWIVLILVLFLVLGFAASALAVVVLTEGPGGHRGLIMAAGILGVLLLVLALAAVGRLVRRAAAPLGDVMDAADRVAAGDHDVRVEERGPREMRRLARSFNAMVERLRAAEQQRRNLLADVTHELRTPLSVIRGDVEGILDGVYTADRDHLEPVLKEARVMTRLLDDLQTLSTAEAGALRLHRQPVEPEVLVGEAVSSFRARAGNARLSLEQRVDGGLPAVDVDPVRIGEVLANLLSNALRHTPTGGTVVVTAERHPRGVWFSVQDTGPGIPPEILPHVFDRFVKRGDSRGAGLGLAIARSLVEAHGGEITAESTESGTSMRFILPAAP